MGQFGTHYQEAAGLAAVGAPFRWYGIAVKRRVLRKLNAISKNWKGRDAFGAPSGRRDMGGFRKNPSSCPTEARQLLWSATFLGGFDVGMIWKR